ncbi:MAG: PIN domain-containing protein [Erysipelotrichaceae bacterium]
MANLLGLFITLDLLLILYLLWKNHELEKKEKGILMKKIHYLKNQIVLEKTYQENIPFKNKLPHLCAGKNLYLIDFENIGEIPHEITKDEKGIIFVFVGNHQKQTAKKQEISIDGKTQVYYIQMDKTMHNYLDIYLSCWVGGMISSAFLPKKIYLVSQDKGFAAIIEAAKVLGYADIDYYEWKENTPFEPVVIEKIIKNIAIVHPSNSMSFKTFKMEIRKNEPKFSQQEVSNFIETAKDLHLIEIIKMGKKYHVILSQ